MVKKEKKNSEEIEKFKQLLTYVVNFCTTNNINLVETKLWKILYFCESDYFEKHWGKITKVNYYKNIYGSTPDKKIINAAIGELKEHLLIEKIEKPDGKKITTFKTKKEYPCENLSGQEVEEIRKACEKYSRLGTSELTLLAHKDPPYLIAKKQDKINFDFVRYREDETEEPVVEKTNYEGEISDEAIRRLLDYAGAI